MRKTRRNAVGVSGFAASFVLVLGLTAYACTNLATLNLSNTAGRAGDTITVTGSSFLTTCVCGPQMPPTPVKIRWGGVQGRVVAEVLPEKAGALSAAFAVPDVTPGYYVIAATQRDDAVNLDTQGTPALVSFEVLTPTGQSVVPESQVAAAGVRADAASSSGFLAATIGLGILGLALFVGGSAGVIRQVTGRRARVPAVLKQD